MRSKQNEAVTSDRNCFFVLGPAGALNLEKSKMTAIERLNNARSQAKSGQFAHALAELVWFHNYALQETPALSGVRLSYALQDWINLGTVYPLALTALKEIRDQKTARLLLGELARDAFRDVVAINEYLNTTSETYTLYVELMTRQADLAAACARSALPSIVDARDYRLAANLMPAAEPAIRQSAQMLDQDVRTIKNRHFTNAPERWAYIRIYAESVQRLLTIIAGNGDLAEATRLKALSVSMIESPSLRREVQAELSRPAKAPKPKFRRSVC